MQSIKTPGSVWAKLIEQQSANAKKPDGRGDAFVYFVGGRGSGKSTLLNRFLYPGRVEVPKPSEGLEYTYARKPSNFDHERKDLAHIWEVGGSQEFAEQIAQSDQLFLTVKQVTTAVVVIVVDMSDPASILPSLLGWLEHVKKKLSTTYEKFEKKGLQLPEQLRTRAKNKLYSGNDDKDVVYHSGISLVIAATKYDAFRDAEPEVKKIVSRTLRYIAHANGAFLTYLSGLHSMGVGGGDTGKDAATDRALLDNFTRLMNHLIFTGLEKKPTLKLAPQTDHAGPLMVPAGADKFKDVGRPRGVMDGNVQAGLQEWKEMCDKLFPPKQASKAAKFTMDERYKEEEVDLVMKRKLQDLDQYRKEQEMAKEAAKKKVAAMKAGAKATSRTSESGAATKSDKTSSSKDKAPLTGLTDAPPPPPPTSSGTKKKSSSSSSKVKAASAEPAAA